MDGALNYFRRMADRISLPLMCFSGFLLWIFFGAPLFAYFFGYLPGYFLEHGRWLVLTIHIIACGVVGALFYTLARAAGRHLFEQEYSRRRVEADKKIALITTLKVGAKK